MRRHLSSTSAVRVGTPDVASELDWEHVYDVHAPRLRRLIRRKVEAAAIDDVLQETFLRAFKSRHTIDRALPMKPWLNTIALRTIADVQRSAVRTVETLDVDTECDELAFACDALDEELLTRAKQNGIKHAFASLNSRHRRLLQLVDIEGMPYEYVARHEQMTTDAVKAALARARSNFRASYVVFTQKSGLFGAGALVGSMTLKVRLRLQRWQDFVTHHAAGVGAATLTVAVVAGATIPSARPAASQATAPTLHETFAIGGSVALPEAGTVAAARVSGVHQAEVPRTELPPDQPTTVRTDVEVTKRDQTYTVTIQTAAESSDGKTWVESVTTIECDANPASTAQCAALEVLPTL